jgi:hypothetical protein
MTKKIIIGLVLVIVTTLFAQDLIVPWFKVSGTLTTGSLVTGTMTTLGLTNTGTFTNTGKIVATDSLRIGANTTTDNKVPRFVLKGDADSDASAIAKTVYTMVLTPNATPASAYWDVSSTYNRFRWGGATDYVSLEPTNTAGMLNIVQTASANWTGISITGAGFNNSSDYWLYFASATNSWTANGSLTAAYINATTSMGTNGTFTINSTATDGEAAYDFVMNADMDADGTVLMADEFRISATPNATPTLGRWDFTSTQAWCYKFDRTIVTVDTVSARENAGSVYTYFIPGGSLVSSSSPEQKENIIQRTMSNTDSLLRKIKIYEYNFKSDSLKSKHVGMMADEWHQISAGFGGNKNEINYEHVFSFMLLALKNQNNKIIQLEKRVVELEKAKTLTIIR